MTRLVPLRERAMLVWGEWLSLYLSAEPGDVIARMEGGPYAGHRFLVQGPTPPSTLHITDWTEEDVLYLRTSDRFGDGSDDWRYITSSRTWVGQPRRQLWTH